MKTSVYFKLLPLKRKYLTPHAQNPVKGNIFHNEGNMSVAFSSASVHHKLKAKVSTFFLPYSNRKVHGQHGCHSFWNVDRKWPWVTFTYTVWLTQVQRCSAKGRSSLYYSEVFMFNTSDVMAQKFFSMTPFIFLCVGGGGGGGRDMREDESRKRGL